MVIRLLFFSSQFFVLLVQILIGCRDKTSVPPAQRARMGFAPGIAHGSRVRREVVKPRDWLINSGWIEASLLFCVMSMQTSHHSISPIPALP